MTTFSNFVSILETDVPRFYEKHYQGLRDKKIGIKPRFEKGISFEIKDDASSATRGVTFSNPQKKEFVIINYDEYCKKISKYSSAFVEKRPSCDFILLEEKNKSIIIFDEMTSAIDAKNLDKPIRGYEQGKRGKMRKQLLNTIETLIVVPQAKEEIEKYAKKECLITIILYEHSVDRDINAPKVFTRFSKVAMKETRGEGLRINNDKFKDKGFQLTELYFESANDTYKL